MNIFLWVFGVLKFDFLTATQCTFYASACEQVVCALKSIIFSLLLVFLFLFVYLIFILFAKWTSKKQQNRKTPFRVNNKVRKNFRFCSALVDHQLLSDRR